MPVWRNARLRRLYGKPDDPIETPSAGSPTGSRTRGRDSLTGNKNGDQSNSSSTKPQETSAPKRVKREKTRPESEYELVHNIPATATEPDYSLLVKPLSESEARVAAYAIHMSRQNWLSGSMFETFWTRKPRGKKLAEGQINLREKMTKLHDCSVTFGPHTFPVRLFTVRDDNVHLDEEADKRIEEQLAKEKEEKEAKFRSEQEKLEKERAETENLSDKPETTWAEQSVGNDPGFREEKLKPKVEVGKKSQKDDKTESTAGSLNHSETEQLPEDTTDVKSSAVTKPCAVAKPKKARKPGPKKGSTRKPKDAISKNLNQKAFEDEKKRLEEQKRRNEELESRLKVAKPDTDDGFQPEAVKEPVQQDNSSLGTNASVSSAQDKQVATPEKAERQPESGNSENPHGTAPVYAHAPPTAQPELPKTTPNQLVVYRLQQMAARDPSLSELMKHVASGTAPPESIAKFQEVINRVKASLFMPMPPVHPTHPSAVSKRIQQGKNKQQNPGNKPQVQRETTIYHHRSNSKAIMLAIEFDEYPTDRCLLPKRSILEYISESRELLWSFLHVSEPQSQDEKPKYTPVTARFHDIPLRVAQILERCVRRPEVVAVHMKEAMEKFERAQPWNIWFQIEKTDEVLLDLIKKTPAPMIMPPPARKPTKPRKPRGPTPAQLRAEEERERQLKLLRVKRGQPLDVPLFIQNIQPQPFVQAPGYQYTMQFRRPMMRPMGIPFQPGFPQGGVSFGATPIYYPNIYDPQGSMQAPMQALMYDTFQGQMHGAMQNTYTPMQFTPQFASQNSANPQQDTRYESFQSSAEDMPPLKGEAEMEVDS